MKLEIVKKKITLYFSAAGAIFAMLCLGGYLYFTNKESEAGRIIAIQSEIDALSAEISASKEAIENAKKYQDSFKNMSTKKKILNGANVQNANETLTKIINQYLAKNPRINFAKPENVKEDIILTKSIKLVKTDIDIEFDAYSDTDALTVLDDFVDSLDGYATLISVKISKSNDYSNEDYIGISKGDAKPLISTNSKISWFSLEKIATEEVPPEQQPTNP